MITSRAIIKNGVNTCPTISITFDGLTVSINVSTKNIIVIRRIGVFCPKIGVIPISYVVAPVLGITSSGPTHMMSAKLNRIAGPLPIFSNNFIMSPSHRAIAIIANKAKPASAIVKPANPTNQLGPDIIPKYGGNIKLPAPKNMANRAKPKVRMSLKLPFFVINYSLLLLFNHLL